VLAPAAAAATVVMPFRAVSTKRRPGYESPGKKGIKHLVHRPLGTYDRRNTARKEKLLGTCPHAARNNVCNPHVTKVLGQKTRLVPGIWDKDRTFNLPVFNIN